MIPVTNRSLSRTAERLGFPRGGPLLTLYPLTELVQALQGAALTQLGRCLCCLLHGSHGECLLQGHHDFINLIGEKTQGSQQNAHLRQAGLRFQDSAKT